MYVRLHASVLASSRVRTWSKSVVGISLSRKSEDPTLERFTERSAMIPLRRRSFSESPVQRKRGPEKICAQERLLLPPPRN